jgi:hypothetical protein
MCATSVELMAACRLLLESTVVARAEPFQFNTAPVANPVPFTVSVNPDVPGAAEAGTNG